MPWFLAVLAVQHQRTLGVKHILVTNLANFEQQAIESPKSNNNWFHTFKCGCPLKGDIHCIGRL
jgi:hypothetical protein